MVNTKIGQPDIKEVILKELTSEATQTKSSNILLSEVLNLMFDRNHFNEQHIYSVPTLVKRLPSTAFSGKLNKNEKYTALEEVMKAILYLPRDLLTLSWEFIDQVEEEQFSLNADDISYWLEEGILYHPETGEEWTAERVETEGLIFNQYSAGEDLLKFKKELNQSSNTLEPIISADAMYKLTIKEWENGEKGQLARWIVSQIRECIKEHKTIFSVEINDIPQHLWAGIQDDDLKNHIFEITSEILKHHGYTISCTWPYPESRYSSRLMEVGWMKN